MASPSSSSTYSAYPTHPQHGGKGLPPPQPAQTNGIIGNPPDLLKRFKLKAKYLKIQKKYFQSIEARKDLTLELAEKEAKQQKLQDEVDLIIDQIYDSDYKHLRPKKDDLFSDDEEENDDEEEGGVKREEEDLEDMEMNRRRQLEEEFGLDSNQQTVYFAPPPPMPIPEPSTSSSKRIAELDPALQDAPQPKRIKLTFGSNGQATAS